jgi:hypothetical protein
MRSKDAFPSKFLRSADAKTRPIIAVISHLKMQPVGQGQDQKQKPVLHLEGAKPMVLNRTNFEILEEAFGDSDDWSGHKIKIKCVRTQFDGKTVDGLLIYPIAPKPTPADEFNDEAETNL